MDQHPQYGPASQQPYDPPRMQQPAYGPPHGAPQRSQALAITALVLGVGGAGLAFLPALRAVGIIIGAVAVVLGIVALIAKSQGGKALAAGGLAAGMAALPIAFILYSVAASQERGNEQRVQDLQACIEENPQAVLDCANNS